jgi:hypothetical protein
MYLAALPALESCPQTPRRPGPRMPFGVTAMECDYCNGMPWCPSLFSPYIYTRRPSLLSHTGAAAQCKAMVAADAMEPLTLIPIYIYIESISLATMQPRVVSLLSNQLKPLTANSTSCQGPSSGSQLESPGGAPAGHGVQTDLATAAALLPQCHCADASARQLAAAAAFRTQSDTPSDGPVVPGIRRFLHLVSWGACWLVML